MKIEVVFKVQIKVEQKVFKVCIGGEEKREYNIWGVVIVLFNENKGLWGFGGFQWRELLDQGIFWGFQGQGWEGLGMLVIY